MLQAILEFLHCIWGKVKVIKCQGQMWWHLWKGTVPMKMMCEYEKNTSSNKNNIGNIKSFMHCLWGNVKVIKGQGHIWWHLWKGIVPMMMLCEYEKNPPSNKQVIGNIRVLCTVYEARSRSLKVKVICDDICEKVLCQWWYCVNMKRIHLVIKKL